jgi:hypothetical protein
MPALRHTPEAAGDPTLGRPSAGRGSSRPARVSPALCLCLLLSAAGCIFDTRTPESPNLQPPIAWIEPTSPGAVLTNVRVTFNAKSVGNYRRSLAEDFSFVPDPADVSFISPANYFDQWSRDDEVNAFSSVFQDSGGVTFTWPAPVPTPVPVSGTPDASFYENLRYKMEFKKVGADTTISGKADLYLRQESGGSWFIYKWMDKQDGLGNATLGLVRWKKKVEY